MAFQAKLTTKLQEYSINDPVIELKTSADKTYLNTIIKNQLASNDVATDGLVFDFIVGGKLLNLPVDKHLELYSDELDAKALLNEKLVEVEYILSPKPPKPSDSLPHDDWVSCVDANESYIISGSYDNSIRIFSAKERKPLLTLDQAHDKSVTKVHWCGRNFISCGHDEVAILWEFNNGQAKKVSTFKGHNRSVNCVDTYDDLVATGSYDKTLRIWSAKPAESIMTLTGHQDSVTGVRWFDSSTLATCSIDMTISIWDVEVGESKRRLTSAKPLLSIDLSQENNLILSGSCDRYIRAWDTRASDGASANLAYTSHNAWISSVAFGSGHHFVSGGYDNLVKMWDLRSTKACMYDLIGHHDKVLDVNWNNPKFILSGSADSTLKVFSHQ